MNDYEKFLEQKSQLGGNYGFEPTFMPALLFPFQVALTQWATMKGLCAIFADCGLGKTFIQLTWAENVARKTDKPVLILAPLAVSGQTVKEADKIGVDCQQSRDGKVMPRITVTNYEKLHLFNPSDFAGCVCDESSILKHFTGATQMQVTRFMNKMPYRLLCTATAAPNDYIELGTSSEALGELNYSDMLSRFFKQLDDKGQKSETKRQDFDEKASKHFAKLSFRVSQTIGQYRLKHHAITAFWKWVCSWSRACRKPSDLGFDDTGFILPELQEQHHIITPTTPPEGMLFCMPAFGLREEREERRRTMKERCEFVASLVNHSEPAVIWCHMNKEGDLLEKIIPDAQQIKGSTPDDMREELYAAFSSGNQRVLIIKPKIGAWGLNWQHCAHVVTFASHSYEQFYQSIRRCWRFGQKRPVRLDVVATEGERGVFENMMRKSQRADAMFTELVKHMNDAQKIERVNSYTNKMEVPSWSKNS
jgi:superfamily II DNA or RNA helicase